MKNKFSVGEFVRIVFTKYSKEKISFIGLIIQIEGEGDKYDYSLILDPNNKRRKSWIINYRLKKLSEATKNICRLLYK